MGVFNRRGSSMTESSWDFGAPEKQPERKIKNPKGIKFFAVTILVVCLSLFLCAGITVGATKIINDQKKKSEAKINERISGKPVAKEEPEKEEPEKEVESAFAWFDNTGKLITGIDIEKWNIDGMVTLLNKEFLEKNTPNQPETPDQPKPPEQPDNAEPKPSPAPAPAPNRAPVVSVSGPTQINRGQTASFSASAYDPDGDSVSLSWSNTNKCWTIPGIYTVSCSATDSRGATGYGSISVNVI
jgi:hypothetical protein